jgi:hypothetical protein
MLGMKGSDEGERRVLKDAPCGLTVSKEGEVDR